MRQLKDSKPRPTLSTIAKMTGLSLSTVSLSLRGGENLKEETRLKVAAAAREVGYVPDRAGVRLRTGKTNVIALVLDSADESIDYARHMIQGIGSVLKGTPYHLSVIPEFDRQSSADTIRYLLKSRTADGIIITHTSPRDPRVQLLIDAGLPFVSHGRTEFFTPHAWYDFHGEKFVQEAIQRLANQGCKSVMLLAKNDCTTNYHNILRSFLQTANNLNLEIHTLPESTFEQSDNVSLRTFGIHLSTQTNRPDGIVCDSEMHAMTLASGLRENGVSVGKDIQIICKQTSDILPILFPEIDGIVEDVHAAGEELTRLLLRSIDGESAETLQILAEPDHNKVNNE